MRSGASLKDGRLSRKQLKRKLGLNLDKGKISMAGPASPLYELMHHVQ